MPTGVATRRAWIAGATQAGVAGMLLAACAGGREGVGKPSSEPVTLRVSSAANEMGEMAAARYPAFTTKYPNVKAEFEDTPDFSAKLTVLAAANSLSDL